MYLPMAQDTVFFLFFSFLFFFFRCKHTRVYLQARAWVQVYPTQRHSGAGTWTPGGFQLSFKGWSRGPPEGLEQFLKFCLHFDMGPSRALSSVLILIGASCPWPGLSFDSIVGLSRTLSCKQQRFHTWKWDVTLSLFAEDAELETGNPRASTKTC